MISVSHWSLSSGSPGSPACWGSAWFAREGRSGTTIQGIPEPESIDGRAASPGETTRLTEAGQEPSGSYLRTFLVNQGDTRKELCPNGAVCQSVVEHPSRSQSRDPAASKVVEEGNALVVECVPKAGRFALDQLALSRWGAVNPDFLLLLVGHVLPEVGGSGRPGDPKGVVPEGHPGCLAFADQADECLFGS